MNPNDLALVKIYGVIRHLELVLGKLYEATPLGVAATEDIRESLVILHRMVEGLD